MKKFFFSAFAVLAAAASQPSFAVAGYTGYLSFIGTDWDGAGYIFALSNTSGPCGGQFSMNAGAAGYKDQVATLMLLWSLGQQASVVTDGTCPNGRANVIGVGTQGTP